MRAQTWNRVSKIYRNSRLNLRTHLSDSRKGLLTIATTTTLIGLCRRFCSFVVVGTRATNSLRHSVCWTVRRALDRYFSLQYQLLQGLHKYSTRATLKSLRLGFIVRGADHKPPSARSAVRPDLRGVDSRIFEYQRNGLD